jgi:hypothetical protein
MIVSRMGCCAIAILITAATACTTGHGPSPEATALLCLTRVNRVQRDSLNNTGHTVPWRNVAELYNEVSACEIIRNSGVYTADLRIDRTTYSVTLRPIRTEALQSFYTDESAVIRYRWAPEVADANSPLVQ